MVYFWAFQNTPNHEGCLQDQKYRLYNSLSSSLPSIFPLSSNFRAVRRNPTLPAHLSSAVERSRCLLKGVGRSSWHEWD